MNFKMKKAKKEIEKMTEEILGASVSTGENEDEILMHIPLINPINKEKIINIEVLLFEVGNLYISFMCDEFKETEELYKRINDFNFNSNGIFKAYIDQDEYKGKLFIELNVIDVFDLERLKKYYHIALTALFNDSQIAKSFHKILELNEE